MLALWTVHTYAIDAAQITLRLAIVSPQKRCGKTTLIALVGAVTSKLTFRTLFSGSMMVFEACAQAKRGMVL